MQGSTRLTLNSGLSSPDPAVCQMAIAAVAQRGDADDSTLGALVDCLGREHKAIQRRAAEAFAVLHQQGCEVTSRLVGSLQSPRSRQRWGAAYALVCMGIKSPHMLPVLLEAIGDSDGDVRWAAADALVRMPQDASLLGALTDLLRSGSSAQRKMAAYCLRDLDARSPDVEQLLLVAIDAEDPRVRIAAMSSLSRLASDRCAAARRVVRALHDADAGVRRAAAAVLGTLGDGSEPVLSALLTAEASPDLSLRRAAQRSLRLLRR